MRHLLILLSLTIITLSSSAQVGYLGKRFTLTAGISIAPPILNHMFQDQNPQRLNNIIVFHEFAVLPPEIHLNADIVLSERVQFSLGGAWRGLQNTGFYSYYYDSDPVSGDNFYTDSFTLKTNALDLSASFKFYTEYAPVGKYVEIGGGMTRATSDVFPTYSVRHANPSTSVETTVSDKREPGIYTSNTFRINLGFGRTRMLNKSLILDYGFRSSYYFGKRDFGPVTTGIEIEDWNYQESFPDIITYIQSINLQSSYAFEIYFNFGLLL
ncbi:MAG: hypothetical protein ACI837_000790 [Crocinitomicaceae bacterium]|jgi:hypothetical protein